MLDAKHGSETGGSAHYNEQLSYRASNGLPFTEETLVKRIISIVMAMALLVQASGCTVKKVQPVNAPNAINPVTEKIVGITTKTGEQVSFQPPGAVIQNGKLKAKVDNQDYEIAIEQVDRFWIERRETSAIRTIGLVAAIAVGTIAVTAVIIVATKESCPFVYSWDGRQYAFDAEPYGGAITRGLERDDYSELEQLVPDKGRYRLMIRNEVAETQYTNLMELMVADHTSDRVAMDDRGNVFPLSKIEPPTTAFDETGRDLLLWLKAADKRIWEPDPETNPEASVRQEIRLSFPKPLSATNAKLVVNAGTSLWGSYMIKALSELQGSGMEDWYASIDNNPLSLAVLRAWSEREELFMLKIEVEESGSWVQRGMLLGGGPLVLEDRIVNLDVSRVTGDRLPIRIRPPKGFWAFNSFGVDYTPNQSVEVQVLHPIECRDASGRDRLAQVTAADGSYYDMPNIGEYGYVDFMVPASKPGAKRTVFLHTRGYYRIHGDGSGQADNEAFGRIMTVPDAAARFAGLRFAAWQLEHGARR